MNDVNARDEKLIQYLNEAYGKEHQLETALTAHIQMTTRAPYKKRLQQHLRETKSHAQAVKRRINQLGGKAEASSVPGPGPLSEVAGMGVSTVQRAAELARGPWHAVRGTSEQEKMLKNAKTEFSEEAEEIANYKAIEALAQSVGDKETARVAREILRDEQRMSSFLEKLIPQLTGAVAKEEIPAELRNGSRTRRSSGSGTRRRSSSASRRTSARGTGRSSSSSRSSSGRSTSGRSASARSTSGRSSSGSSARGSTRRSSSGRSSSARSASSRSGAAGSSRSRSGAARSGSKSTSGSRAKASSRSAGSSARRAASSAARRSGASPAGGRTARAPAAGSRSSGGSRGRSSGSGVAASRSAG
jgi:ferritin-like metal-binding protein YciE